MREQSVYQQFVKSLPSRKGIVIVMCPKCLKIIKQYDTTINKLNEWAFNVGDKKDTCIEKDGKGCCF